MVSEVDIDRMLLFSVICLNINFNYAIKIIIKLQVQYYQDFTLFMLSL